MVKWGLQVEVAYIKSVLLHPGAKFTTFDISNFYLQTPLDRPEYVRVSLSDNPDEIFQEYNLLAYTSDGWIYFEIRRDVYGLPQSGMRSNKLLKQRLNKAG